MGKVLVIQDANFGADKLDTITYDVIHATDISLSESSLTFDQVGETVNLTYTVTPSNMQDNILWSSSDPNVASVSSSGTVTVNGVGSCMITVRAGNVSASCEVSCSVYLSDYGNFVRSLGYAGTNANYITSVETRLGTTMTKYDNKMVSLVAEKTYTDGLIIFYDMAYYDETAGMCKVQTDPTALSSNSNRTWTNIGYPFPIRLPNNCTKIKCICMDEKYGALPLFFKCDVRAYNQITESGTYGKSSCCAYRFVSDYTDPYQKENSNWTFQKETEYTIPDGCDGIVVNWAADESNGGIPFMNMTEAQKAQFKILCL